MYTLTDKQIDFILNDISNRGVKLESLQQGILDHVCCILENELENEENFEKKYKEVIATFFKKDLAEIQTETTLLLNFKHYYLMKKLLYLFLFLSISYNLFMAGSYVHKVLEMRKAEIETVPEKNVTVKDGFEELKSKIKSEHPEVKLTPKIFVGYLSDFFSSYFTIENESLIAMESEWRQVSEDSVRQVWKYKKDKLYNSMDSLAQAHPGTTFIIAFQRTGSDIKETISEHDHHIKNLFYLSGMNKLYSGYKNDRGKVGGLMNLTMLLDSGGKVLYQGNDYTRTPINKKLTEVLEKR